MKLQLDASLIEKNYKKQIGVSPNDILERDYWRSM